MAHFAKLDNKHTVTDVVVVHNNVLLDSEGKEQEQLGINFLIEVTGHSWWVQTSYNGNFRGQYAAKGYTYYKEIDAFVAPQPYPSWTLDTATGFWVAPVTMPEMTETKVYEWDESITNWKEIDLDA
tara:strand:+ start:265 stop:642 length:378 start_codon:yes stop_codon:yes gene_type:complete